MIKESVCLIELKGSFEDISSLFLFSILVHLLIYLKYWYKMRLIDDTVILKVSSKSDIKNLKTRIRTLKLSLLEKYQEKQKKNHWPENHDIVTLSRKSEFLIWLFHRSDRTATRPHWSNKSRPQSLRILASNSTQQ